MLALQQATTPCARWKRAFFTSRYYLYKGSYTLAPGAAAVSGGWSMPEMTFVSTLFLGLLGGFHCAGICGGIVVLLNCEAYGSGEAALDAPGPGLKGAVDRCPPKLGVPGAATASTASTAASACMSVPPASTSAKVRRMNASGAQRVSTRAAR
jgi:hypothetical protein